jgi:DNA-directed RNA polymerase specialized sigma24 family protein
LTGPGQTAPEGFAEFFRSSFRDLVRTAMIAGADLAEAEDAADKTLEEMLRRWPVRYPLAYARKAVANNFVKDKTRGNRRVVQRLVDRGHVLREEGVEDGRLAEWEDDQWVAWILSALPPAQREVMQYIAQGLDREGIAEALGITRAAVRRRLCDARAHLAALLNPDGELRQPGPAPARSSPAARSSREEAR